MDLEAPLHISELNSAIVSLRLKRNIALFSSEMCRGASKSTSHLQTMTCPLGGARPPKPFPRPETSTSWKTLCSLTRTIKSIYSGCLMSRDGVMLTVHDHDFEEKKNLWYLLYVIKRDAYATAKCSPPNDPEVCPTTQKLVR